MPVDTSYLQTVLAFILRTCCMYIILIIQTRRLRSLRRGPECIGLAAEHLAELAQKHTQLQTELERRKSVLQAMGEVRMCVYFDDLSISHAKLLASLAEAHCSGNLLCASSTVFRLVPQTYVLVFMACFFRIMCICVDCHTHTHTGDSSTVAAVRHPSE